MHLAYGEAPIPDCTRCRDDPSLRPEFGCDRPAEAPVFEVSCSACGGSGCSRCEKGARRFYRCPGALVQDRADIRLAFWLCRHSEDGMLPAPGGLMDQAGGFVELLQAYQHERGLIDEARREAQEREAERQRKIADRKSGVIRG